MAFTVKVNMKSAVIIPRQDYTAQKVMLVVVIINIIDRQFSKEEEAVGTPLAEHMYSGDLFKVKLLQTTILKAGCFPTQHWKCLRKK